MSKITFAKTVAYTIATIAAVSSYGHQVALLALADIDPLFGIIPGEWVTPATVDALAIIALMVRTHDESTANTKRWALVPLVLAGGMSIAANVATAHNPVQVIVGIWTVLAYMVAELFVAKMKTKTASTDETPAETQVTPEPTPATPPRSRKCPAGCQCGRHRKVRRLARVA